MTPAAVIPKGYCACGCGGETNIVKRHYKHAGHVKGEPYRYLRGHARRKSPVDWLEDEESGCWLWQLSLDGTGYGMSWVDGKIRKAHRVVYERLKGPIPKGLVLDHLCRNRQCVNPDHLDPVTHAENLRRGAEARWREEQQWRDLSLLLVAVMFMPQIGQK